MSLERGLLSSLKNILKLLKKEKLALVKNDTNKIDEIVRQKTELIEGLAKYKGLDIQNNKEAMDIIKEINSLQELNLLLTKQALSYQNTILESMSKNIGSASNTYSSKGKYDTGNSINIIDHSV